MARKQQLPLIERFEDIPEAALVPEAEQPYPIPAHWKWVRLGSVINLLSGWDEPLASCNSERQGIPYLMGASNFYEGQLRFERWITEPKVISKRGDLLMTVKGTVGKMAVQEEANINLSRQVMALQPTAVMSVEYLKYYLATIIKKLVADAVGLIPGIARVVLLGLPIPLPPLAEQQPIAEKLRAGLEQIDDVANQLEAFLEGVESRTENVLGAAMQGHLTQSWRRAS